MRNIRKTIRFTEEEYQKIEKELKRDDVNFTIFARATILKQKIKLPIEKKLLYELNKIGNNLNQIARAVNSKERISTISKLIEIEKHLEAIRNGS